MTLGELMVRMDAWEWGLWVAEYERSPWDERRADLRAGIVSSTLANIHRAKDAKAFRPVDFMPYVKAEEDAQPVDEVAAFLDGLRGNVR